MDLTGHSQGNQDCRPFLYMSSSVNGANQQVRRWMQKVGEARSLEHSRRRPKESKSKRTTLKQEVWPGPSFMAAKDCANAEKKNLE
jgi:hypothetical protein